MNGEWACLRPVIADSLPINTCWIVAFLTSDLVTPAAAAAAVAAVSTLNTTGRRMKMRANSV